MANPFVNDWLVGLAAKDAFSRAVPEKDAVFAISITLLVLPRR